MQDCKTEQLNSSCVYDLVCSSEVVRDATWRQSDLFLCECELCPCASGSMARFTIAVQITINSLTGRWVLAAESFDLSILLDSRGRGLDSLSA